MFFLIFVNDLPLSNELTSFLFADDTTSLTTGTDINITGQFVNTQLNKLGQWLRSHELSINTTKTKVMIFSNNKKIPAFPFNFDLNEPNSQFNPAFVKPLEVVTNQSANPTIKMLGVLLDEKLSFDDHCSNICKKINKALFHIRSVRNTLSSAALTKLYYALIHPHLLYCLTVFSFTSKKNLKLLRNKQKQCIRLIHKAKHNAHTEPLFYKSQILPLDDLITQQKLLLMHSLFHNYSKVSFPDFFLNSEVNVHRFSLRNENDFHVPRTNSSFIQKMPLIDFPNTWNELDQSLKEISSRGLFKKQLKLFLLDKYANFRCNNLLCYSCLQV